MRATVILLTLALAACKTAPPIAVDGFCENFTPKDFTDLGLKAQNDNNLRADLANDNVHARQCRLKPDIPRGPR